MMILHPITRSLTLSGRMVLLVLAGLVPGMLLSQWGSFGIIDTSKVGVTRQEGLRCDISRSGHLGVAWLETSTDRRNPIVVEISTDHGKTFVRHTVIDSVLSNGSDSDPFDPYEDRVFHDMKFAGDDTIWVLWSKLLIFDYPVIDSLRLSRSIDGGETFTQVMTEDRGDGSLYPRLAVASDGSLFVVWDGDQPTCTRLIKGSVSERNDVVIQTGPHAMDPDISLAIDSLNNVYCAWSLYMFDSVGHSTLFCSVSHDSGQSFAGTAQVDYQAGIDRPALTASADGTVHLLYRRLTDHWTFDIRYSRSLDYAATFEPPHVLATPETYNSTTASYLSPSGGLLLSWSIDGALFVSRSADGGSTFQGVQPIDTTRYVRDQVVAIDDAGRSYSIAVSGPVGKMLSAVFLSMADGVDAIRGDSPSIPRQMQLLQNYPNPFNPSTTISYTLPTQSFVVLKVVNVLGQEVATLVNGIESPGTNSVRFDGSGLPSGAYFYRLQAGSYSATKMLMIVK